MAESENGQKKAYLFEIHFLRALACLMVVGVHVSATNAAMNDDSYNTFTYFLNQIGRFGTPIFALISGFLLFLPLTRKKFKLGYFLKSRISKILIPFLLWSIVYRYVRFIYEKWQFGDPMQEAITIISGNAFYHLYFVAIVVQFYIVFPLLQKLFKTQSLILVFAFISFIISYKLYGFHPNIEGPLGDYLGGKSFMPIWIFYFAFGGFMAFYWKGITAFAKKRKWLMLILSLAIFAGAIVEYNVKGYVSNRRISNLVNIPLLSIGVVGLYPFLAKWNVIKKPLVVIGQYSMGIYLVHPLILYLMARHLPQEYWNMNYAAIMFAAVLLIAAAGIRIIQFIPFSSYFIPVPKITSSKKQPNPAAAAERQPA